MECIKTLVDEDLGLKSIEFNNPRIRYGARGIIINNEGKIAVFYKANRNQYKLPGGGIDEGEKIDVAFKREALEETGCEIEILKELGTIEEHKSLDNFKQISYLFVAKVTKDNNTSNFTEEEKDSGAKLLWVNENEALELITKCIYELKESDEKNLYHSKYIVLRDRYILEYYLNNK
ncbi:MAG: NUDIX domain-containing protein [Bacilli bacterium]|nr:NUDIX domain-containing protein [Bacilli bacterium]